jgi:hypothetical protein
MDSWPQEIAISNPISRNLLIRFARFVSKVRSGEELPVKRCHPWKSLACRGKEEISRLPVRNSGVL